MAPKIAMVLMLAMNMAGLVLADTALAEQYTNTAIEIDEEIARGDMALISIAQEINRPTEGTGLHIVVAYALGSRVVRKVSISRGLETVILQTDYYLDHHGEQLLLVRYTQTGVIDERFSDSYEFAYDDGNPMAIRRSDTWDSELSDGTMNEAQFYARRLPSVTTLARDVVSGVVNLGTTF